MEGARDGLLAQGDVWRLRARFPQAVVKRLADGGHLDVVTRPYLFIDWIRDFLQHAA